MKEYPWFLETWDNYRFPIQRADSIRYFILAHHGGIYVDLDNVSRQRNI
jgi:mannosyltransferase OCH1-like enzyme